jgi:hypothetical protein
MRIPTNEAAIQTPMIKAPTTMPEINCMGIDCGGVSVFNFLLNESLAFMNRWHGHPAHDYGNVALAPRPCILSSFIAIYASP